MRELERVEVREASERGKKTGHDMVIVEREVVLRLNGRNHRSFYCMPTHLEELARGYLISEGICRPANIKHIEIRSDGAKFIVAATIDSHIVKLNEIKAATKISMADVWKAGKQLEEKSILHGKTRGTHVAGILGEGNSMFVEDISRHCAIDKAIGMALQNKIDLITSTLVTSCRQTETTIKKAIYSRIPIVVSIAAVTTLAIESARKYGVTLVGFARERNFSIYSHEERIVESK